MESRANNWLASSSDRLDLLPRLGGRFSVPGTVPKFCSSLLLIRLLVVVRPFGLLLGFAGVLDSTINSRGVDGGAVCGALGGLGAGVVGGLGGGVNDGLSCRLACWSGVGASFAPVCVVGVVSILRCLGEVLCGVGGIAIRASGGKNWVGSLIGLTVGTLGGGRVSLTFGGDAVLTGGSFGTYSCSQVV